jgi:hypothetical protein
LTELRMFTRDMVAGAVKSATEGDREVKLADL